VKHHPRGETVVKVHDERFGPEFGACQNPGGHGRIGTDHERDGDSVIQSQYQRD
jgi:hypothetical protein